MAVSVARDSKRFAGGLRAKLSSGTERQKNFSSGLAVYMAELCA